MSITEKFSVRPALLGMKVGETIEFPCGRDEVTHILYGDRRPTIRATAAALKKTDGLCYTVRVESVRTLVTRLDDLPGSGRYRENPARSGGVSIRAQMLAMELDDFKVFPRERSAYIRVLASQLKRTEGRTYTVNVEGYYARVSLERIQAKRKRND